MAEFEADQTPGDSLQRTIGLLGGMTWQSTIVYYRIINEVVRERLGGAHSARCLLYSFDFAEIERIIADGEWSQAASLLRPAATQLESAGAELVVLCANTMHIVADEVQDAVHVPLLHVGDATAVQVHALGLDRVGLIGTKVTMTEPFLRDRLASRGLLVSVPAPSDANAVDRVIFDELTRGELSGSARGVLRDVAAHLVTAGAEGIILGCTEFPLVLRPGDIPVPILDTTSIHATAAAEAALTP